MKLNFDEETVALSPENDAEIFYLQAMHDKVKTFFTYKYPVTYDSKSNKLVIKVLEWENK